MLTRDGGRCRGIGVAVLGVALLLSGCSGDDGSNEGTVTVDVSDAPSGPDGAGSSTGVGGDGPSSSDEPSDPVPEPSEHPKPERPAAMDDTGEKGAIAAAEYFFELYNYAVTTGQLGELEQMSYEECEFCESILKSLEETYSRGGRIEGNIATVSIVEAEPTVDGLAFQVTLELNVQDGIKYAGNGSPTRINGTSYSDAKIGLQHMNEWVVLAVQRGTV